jgi:Secretion system C-terminal sorting domain
MKKFILTALLLTAYTLDAQYFEWLKTPECNISLNPDMIGYCTAADDSGNLYFAGFKDTPTPYNDILGRLYFNKYTPGGALAFEKIIEGKAQVYNMITDDNSNIIAVFGWLNTITIGNLTLTTINQGMQYVLVKFDTQGELLWHQELVIDAPEGSGLNYVQESRGLSIDNEQNIYITYGNFGNTYISKFSADGNELLTIEQTNVSRITSVSIDNEGNIYSAGSCVNWEALFGGTHIQTQLPYTAYVAKYNPQGACEWVKLVEDITCSEPHVVAQSLDNVYFAGPLFGVFAFDDIVVNGNLNFNGDFYLAKLNAQGVFQWVRETPEGASFMLGYRNFLSLDNQGNIYLSGRASANIDWGNGITSGGEGLYKTAIVLKFNSEGNPIMAKTATSEFSTRFDGVSITNEGDIYVAGIGLGEASFGNITYTPQNEQEYYPFAAKLSENAAGLPNENNKSLSIYPNPAKEYLYINRITDPISGSIYTITGQKVKDFEATEAQGINVTDLCSGIYILKAGSIVSKFIKQ